MRYCSSNGGYWAGGGERAFAAKHKRRTSTLFAERPLSRPAGSWPSEGRSPGGLRAVLWAPILEHPQLWDGRGYNPRLHSGVERVQSPFPRVYFLHVRQPPWFDSFSPQPITMLRACRVLHEHRLSVFLYIRTEGGMYLICSLECNKAACRERASKEQGLTEG